MIQVSSTDALRLNVAGSDAERELCFSLWPSPPLICFTRTHKHPLLYLQGQCIDCNQKSSQCKSIKLNENVHKDE